MVADARLSDWASDQRANGDRVFRDCRTGAGSTAYFDPQVCCGWRRALGKCQRSANSVSADAGGATTRIDESPIWNLWASENFLDTGRATGNTPVLSCWIFPQRLAFST